MSGTAFGGVVRARLATLLAGICALSACGGEPAPTATVDGGQAATAETGGAPVTRRPDGLPAAVAATASAIDTSNWVLQPPFYAAGDEPFWRLEIIDGWFSFKRSGLPEIEAPLAQPTRAGAADVFETPPLKVSLKREACETSGGGRTDVSAVVTFDEIEFIGCAFAVTASAGVASSPEATAVIESVAAIDACLGKLGVPALVTAVYPREPERTAVALRAQDGSIYECAVEADGNTIAFLDAMEPRSAGPWMSRMRFLRAGVSDSTRCATAEDVRAGDTVLGRLLPQSCRF